MYIVYTRVAIAVCLFAAALALTFVRFRLHFRAPAQLHRACTSLMCISSYLANLLI